MDETTKRRVLKQLTRHHTIGDIVTNVAQAISAFGWAVGSLAPGDLTTYQFAVVSAHPFHGNGTQWVIPGQRVWYFGTTTDLRQLVMEQGQYLHGMREFHNEHTALVAELFISLVESEIPGSMGMGDSIEIIGLWQEELQERGL